MDTTNHCPLCEDYGRKLTAAEKRASEAEAKCAGYRKVLHQISDKSQCNWARFVSGAELGEVDARAQAVAEVLEAVRKWHETESQACELFTAIDEYFAKLDAARKGE